MKTNLDLVQQFGTKQMHTKPLLETPYVVTLSRVSSKRQFEETLSIENQEKLFEEHAARTGKTIIARFGSTYESAKTDERKEFKKMIEFVKRTNARGTKKVCQIWVYMTDRFSRTGVGGMGIAEELREKYGVALYAISQPTSVKDESGIFSQNLQFLFSNYENRIRRKRMIDGMTAKFRAGDWVTILPVGYSAIRQDKKRTIVINEDGKKLRHAFVWKAEGMKNEEIIQRLKAMGLKVTKQLLTKTFKKPFYCGLINHGMLDGQVIKGNHPPLVSVDLFLKVNGIHQNAGNYGVPHQKVRDELPLKVYAKCEECGQPFTGYCRKKKTSKKLHHFYYYKCRTNGCKCNKKAKDLHELYKKELDRFIVKQQGWPVIVWELAHFFDEISKDNVERERALRLQLAEVTKKMETIEEKLYLNEMPRATYDKYNSRYQEERYKIAKDLEECCVDISNLDEKLLEAVKKASELATEWDSSDKNQREILQNLVFPEGIYYDREKDQFRTPKVNFIFELIALQSGNLDENGKATTHLFDELSPAAEREGFEPPEV